MRQDIDTTNVPACLIPFLENEFKMTFAKYIHMRAAPHMYKDLQSNLDRVSDSYKRNPTLQEFAAGIEFFLIKLDIL